MTKAKRIIPCMLAILMITFGFTGCGKTENIEVGTKASGSIKISEIKKAYGVTSNYEQNQLLPFWNVDNDTVFTLHFNSKVEPALAVSVHTDPKCGVNSRVGQLNAAYLCDDGGVDVIVKPGLAVLNENQDMTKAEWGNAPIYYMKINYDRFSSEVTPLETPVIVPFTVRTDVSTPTLKGNIGPDGQYKLSWTPVEGATSYEIYESSVGLRSETNEKIKPYTRSELGYKGDHLDKIGEVSGTEFTDFNYKEGMGNTIELNGEVTQQNAFLPLTYFVRAKTSDGKVSNFSMAAEAYKDAGRMPSSVELYEFSEFPETVKVKMKDNSLVSMPINFKKDSVDGNRIKYTYTIPGTLLTGHAYFTGENTKAVDEHISSASVNYGMYQIEQPESIIPANTTDTLSDLQKEIISKDAAKGRTPTMYSDDMRMAVAEMENVRLMNKGLYDKTMEDLIAEYGSIYKNGNETAPQTQTEEPSQPSTTQPETTQPEPQTTPPTEQNSGDTSVTEPSEDNNDSAGNTDPVELPDNNNEPTEEPQQESPKEELVDDNSSNPDIGDANRTEVPGSDYILFADSAEEEYIARMMIAGEENIDISAFPQLQDTTFLTDVFYKVYMQNPFVISPASLTYTPEDKTVHVGYIYDKETMQAKQKEIAEESEKIVKDTVRSSMSDDEIAFAIWNKLEDETEYDTEACNQAMENGFSTPDNSSADAFNAYGIICKKKGVCQSYAYAYKLLLTEAGVDAKVLTGFLNKNLPHAWSIVKVDGNWYWFDLTNNAKNSGIPYMVYESSSQNAEAQDYVLDDMYDINNNLSWVESSDNSKNYYVKNDLIASSVSDIPNKVGNARKLMRYNAYAVFVEGGITEADVTQDLMTGIAENLVASGLSESELNNVKMYAAGNYVIFLEGRDMK